MSQNELEELMELARSGKKTVVKDKAPLRATNKRANELQIFIRDFDIRDGTSATYCKSIYEAYKIWSISPKSKQTFFSEFSKYFTPIREKGKDIYNLNKHGVELIFNATKIVEHREKEQAQQD